MGEAIGTANPVRRGAVVATGIGLAALLQAAFHLVLARILGPAGYSLLAAALTIVLIATPPALALQAAVAREVAWRIDHEGEVAAGVVLRETLRALSRRLAAFGALALPFALVGAVLTDVRDPVAVFSTVATIAGMLMLSLALGGLQGTRRFNQLSAAQCWFAGLKLVAGAALALGGFGAGAVVLGVAVAAWAAAAIAAAPLRGVWERGRSSVARPRRILRGFAGGPALMLALLATLSSLAVLVARLSFAPRTSGAFSALAFAAYALLVTALAFAAVLFPRAGSSIGPSRARLRAGLAAVAALGAVGTALLFAFPETIVRLAFGSEYVFAAPWLGPLGVAMTLFALCNVYVYRFLSLGQSQFTLPLVVLLAAQVALYGVFHSSPGELIAVLIVTAAALLAAAELFELRLRRRGALRRDLPERQPFAPLLPAAPARSLAASTRSVTAVIPAYDEASRIAFTLRDTAACIQRFGCPHEILVVDDGSQDETRRVAENVAAELDCVRVIGYERNAGKGRAVVEGARRARGDLVLFLDADLEVHPRQLRVLFTAMQEADADVVIGSKMHSGSRVDYPRQRRLMSWGYYAIVRLFFGLPVRDTQTGLKLFRREVLDGAVQRMLVKRFAFDLEALVIAHRSGFRIVEAPVVVTRERDLPKIGWLDAAHTGWDTLAVWYRTYLRRHYDRV